jgi:hypothetical protein
MSTLPYATALARQCSECPDFGYVLYSVVGAGSRHGREVGATAPTSEQLKASGWKSKVRRLTDTTYHGREER